MPNFNIISEAEAVKNVLDNFDTVYKKTELNEIPECAKIRNALKSLSELEKSYFEADDLGEYKKVDKETLDKILGAYNNLKKSLDEVDDSNKRKAIKAAFVEESVADKYFDIIDYIKELVNKDINAFYDVKLKKDEKIELPKTIVSIRSRKLVVTDKDLNMEHGNYSERIPVSFTDENGKKHDGYFTKDTTIDYKKDMLNRVQYYFKSILINNGPDEELAQNVYENVKKVFSNDKVMKDPVKLHTIISRLPHILTDYNEAKECERIYKLNPGFYDSKEQFRAYVDEKFLFKNNLQSASNRMFRDKVVKDILAPSNAQGYHIKRSYGSSIAQRNCAMSSVAELLGIERVICHSENMIANIGGQDYKGVFMENAEGNDIGKVTDSADDPFMNCLKANSTNNKAFPHCCEDKTLIKDIADLQVLDFICNNIDRHQNNYSYIFNNDTNRVGRIQGFDNDLSCGTSIDGKRSKKFLSTNALVLSDLQIINKSLADTLRTLQKDSLDFVLKGYNLSSAEKDAIYKRIELVNEAIDNKVITVIDEKDLEKITVNGLAVDKLVRDNQVKNGKLHETEGYPRNLFVQFLLFPNSVRGNLNKNMNKKNNKTVFAKGNMEDSNERAAREISHGKLAEDKVSLDSIYSRMKATDDKVWFGTDEYDRLEKAVLGLSNMTSKAAEAIKRSNLGVNVAYVNEYREKLAQIRTQAKAYIARKADKKRRNSFNRAELNRYDAVVKLAKFADEKISVIDKGLALRKEKVTHGNSISYDKLKQELAELKTKMFTNRADEYSKAKLLVYEDAVALGKENYTKAHITKEDLGKAVKEKAISLGDIPKDCGLGC